MIYAAHRAKSAPVLGAPPGQYGSFGRALAPGKDDTDLAVEESVAAVPTPTDGSGQ